MKLSPHGRHSASIGWLIYSQNEAISQAPSAGSITGGDEVRWGSDMPLLKPGSALLALDFEQFLHLSEFE